MIVHMCYVSLHQDTELKCRLNNLLNQEIFKASMDQEMQVEATPRQQTNKQTNKQTQVQMIIDGQGEQR